MYERLILNLNQIYYVIVFIVRLIEENIGTNSM